MKKKIRKERKLREKWESKGLDPESARVLAMLERYLDHRANSLPSPPPQTSIPRVDGLDNRGIWDPSGPLGVQIEEGAVIGLKLNSIKMLPETIGDLTHLETLYLEDNGLVDRDLPKTFSNLKSLRRLSLKDNRFQSLPEFFGDLTALRDLDLQDNELTALPHAFGNLQSLERLNLKGNAFTTFPESLIRLKSLESLNLQFTRITTLPQSILQLPNLKWLQFHSHAVTEYLHSCELGELRNIFAAGGRRGDERVHVAVSAMESFPVLIWLLLEGRVRAAPRVRAGLERALEEHLTTPEECEAFLARFIAFCILAGTLNRMDENYKRPEPYYFQYKIVKEVLQLGASDERMINDIFRGLYADETDMYGYPIRYERGEEDKILHDGAFNKWIPGDVIGFWQSLVEPYLERMRGPTKKVKTFLRMSSGSFVKWMEDHKIHSK